MPCGIVPAPPGEKGVARLVESPTVQVPRLSVLRVSFFSLTAMPEVLLSGSVAEDLRTAAPAGKGGWGPAPSLVVVFASFLGEGPGVRPNGVMLCVVAESCEREYVCGMEVRRWITEST